MLKPLLFIYDSIDLDMLIQNICKYMRFSHIFEVLEVVVAVAVVVVVIELENYFEPYFVGHFDFEN